MNLKGSGVNVFTGPMFVTMATYVRDLRLGTAAERLLWARTRHMMAPARWVTMRMTRIRLLRSYSAYVLIMSITVQKVSGLV